MLNYGLAGIAGFVLALFFEWFPWVEGKFDQLPEQGKRLVVLASLVIVTGVLFAIGCVPSSPVHVVGCNEAGGWELAGMFLAALTSNQSGHSLMKRPQKLLLK